MHSRQPSPRWALWVFAAALLLKSAMPWLASASAQMQGKTLVEVCTVYGVSMVAPGADAGEPAPGHRSDHGSEHCALTALAAFAPDAFTGFVPLPAPALAASPLRSQRPAPAPDACATWAARLRHGPPSLA